MDIKEHAEGLGYKVFVAPGSTLVYRMIKRHKPKAVVGVGCSMEVKEATEKLAAWGLPVFGFKLLNDGCVATTIDFEKLKRSLAESKKPH
jgi:hypothetical protein